jgi:cobalt-precorrin 5A hydrolase
MSRLVIGLGFRDEASAQAIGEVLSAALRQAQKSAAVIAVPVDKALHGNLIVAAREAGLPIETISVDALQRADVDVTTRSPQIERRRGVGSVCEAAALAAAGAGASLVVSRLISADRHATAAVAISKDVS